MKEKKYFNYNERWKLKFDSEHHYREKRSKTIAFFVTACIAITFLFTLPWIWQYKLSIDLGKTEERIIAYNEVEKVIQEQDRLQADIAKMESFLRTIEDRSKDPRATLEQLEKLLPVGTHVRAFSLLADHSIQIGLVLSGPPEVAKLWVNLRNSGLYEDFDFPSVSLADQSQSIDLTLKLK